MPLVGLVPGASDGFVDHADAFHTLNMISASLSIAGSLAVIVAFVLFAQLRRFFARLILYLAISDLWLCTSMLMGYSRPPHNMKCMVQSALGSFFGLASILWTLAIADAVRRVLLARDLTVESRHETRLHIIAWGSSLASLLVVASTGVAGPAGIGCWIRNTATGSVVRMLTFFIPLWLGVGYAAWVYWNVSSLMSRLLDMQSADGGQDFERSAFDYPKHLERQRRSLRCLLMLPMVLVFCWTPLTIRRLLDMVFPGFAWTPLDYACVIAGPLQGALNAVIYGATPAVRDAMFGRLDHSAHKLKGNLARLRSLRRSRSGARSSKFQRLDEEEGVQTGLRGAAAADATRPRVHSEPPCGGSSDAPPVPDALYPVAAAAAASNSPEPTVLGQPSAGRDRGRSGHRSGSDGDPFDDRNSACGRSSSSSRSRSHGQRSPSDLGRPGSRSAGDLPRVELLPRLEAPPQTDASQELASRSRVAAHSSSVDSDGADGDLSPDPQVACYEQFSEGDSGMLASDSHEQSCSSFDHGTAPRGFEGSGGGPDERSPGS